jgi:hypothetical protein
LIWATQVLESLAQEGISSRTEVACAAMAGRAECAMLNKGPFIREALSFRGGVLHHMQARFVGYECRAWSVDRAFVRQSWKFKPSERNLLNV